MCLTLPGRVVAVDPMGATIDTEGRLRRASTIIVPDVEVGDWVVVGAGSVLQRLDPELALEMRSTLLQAIALEDAEQEAEPGADQRVATPLSTPLMVTRPVTRNPRGDRAAPRAWPSSDRAERG